MKEAVKNHPNRPIKKVKVLESKVNFEKELFFRSGITTQLKTNEENSFEYVIDLSTGEKFSTSKVIEDIEWTPVYSKVYTLHRPNGDTATMVRLYPLPNEEEKEGYKLKVNLGEVNPIASYNFCNKGGQSAVCKEDSEEFKMIRKFENTARGLAKKHFNQSNS